MFSFHRTKISNEMHKYIKMKNEKYVEKCFNESINKKQPKKEKCILYGNNFCTIGFTNK